MKVLVHVFDKGTNIKMNKKEKKIYLKFNTFCMLCCAWNFSLIKMGHRFSSENKLLKYIKKNR